MSPKESAGLLMYRRGSKGIEVFLVHPGGPFFRGKDRGVWSIPKGQPEGGESLQDAARREFREETGLEAEGELLPLGSIRQAGGKRVHAWAFVGEHSPEPGLRSTEFSMEWPPKSGRIQRFPEVDRGAFLALDAARERINPAQRELLERLLAGLEEA